jgi:hypothetical protein
LMRYFNLFFVTFMQSDSIRKIMLFLALRYRTPTTRLPSATPATSSHLSHQYNRCEKHSHHSFTFSSYVFSLAFLHQYQNLFTKEVLSRN